MLAPLGCKSKDQKAASDRAKKAIDKAAAGDKAAPPTFEITAKQVFTTELLAPNKTYADNNLGLKAEAGSTFACVEIAIKNAGTKPATGGTPKLVDASGAKHELSSDAAGKMPTEWKSVINSAPIEPGSANEGFVCYSLPAPAATGALKLVFDETGWGDQGAWQKTVDLPAATPLAAATGSAAK
ncbi:MAG: hypothetical protein SFX73_05435 [Kofleriaceae bacterium]|nr:hypothetical protein [Kofleriaceae bacterium]